MERNTINTAIPFPILITERLYLREITASDLEQIYFLRSDKNVNKFIPRAQQTLETAKNHIALLAENHKKNKSVTWGITTKESNVLIGTICLWNFSEDRKTAEVGYDLHPKFQGKGIMGEALKEVLKFGFENRDFKTIEAYTDFRNIPSKKLLKLHGFIPNKDKKDADNQFNEMYYLNC